MTQNKPTGLQAFICMFGIISLMGWGLFILKANLHSLIILCIVWVVAHAYCIDSDMLRLKQSMVSAIQKSSGMFLFFILIGAVIAGFILSGAIPTLIYYGLTFITPKNFLPIGMLLCSMMSLVIGSCWGTIGTMGVALLGIAVLLHVPLPIAAGMIISGAYFGDKFSPVSDTTVLSAWMAEANLYRHIKALTYSLIPAYLLSLGVFWGVGYYFSDVQTVQITEVGVLRQQLSQYFNIHWLNTAPMWVMLGFSIKKKPAELAMLGSLCIAIFIAIFGQGFSTLEVLNGLFCGPQLTALDSPILNAVFHRGGIQSMLSSMSLTVLILILGGILDSYHIIAHLFARILPSLTNPLRLLTATVLAAIICNLLMGEGYLSIILNARIFKDAYAKMRLEPCALSNALEIGSTLSTPLIPWTSSGVFIVATLGLSPEVYWRWSIFNGIALVVFLGLATTKWMNRKWYTLPLTEIHDA